MAGRSVSGYVDETVAARLSAVARAEARTPTSLVGQAISFYTGLPEVARTALSRIERHADGEERRWLESELLRLFMRADFSMTQRLMAAEVLLSFPEGDHEPDLDAAALEWTAPPRP